MTSRHISRPPQALRLGVLALGVLMLAACGSTTQSSRQSEYASGAVRIPNLEVPPDLTQLARESRFVPQGGVVSASAATAARVPGAGSAPTAAAPAAVALQSLGELRVERQGQQRWLVAPLPPEQLWPRLRSFWETSGFTLSVENAAAGIMETEWSENRARIPRSVARNMLGGVLGTMFDTGERDKFRTRVERTDQGSEIFISHRGIEEVSPEGDGTGVRWRPRPSDASLEAEFLGRLLVALGQTEAVATAAVAQAPEAPARARVVTGQPAATLEMDETFERAWRRVGLALDRGGFSVEDRDRANGLYYVRWIDPRLAGEEPGFFDRLLRGARAPTPVRYRIALSAAGDRTRVSVQTSAGEPETGEDAQRIVAQLAETLR
jgi:outer membrane protein assembly factor BamC